MPRKYPPGPAGHWLLGNLALLRSDILDFLETVPREYGDLATLKMGPYRVILVSHPRWVEQVLVTDHRILKRPPRFHRILRSVSGKGLVASEGPLWLAQRRTLQAAVDQIPVEKHCENVVATARHHIEAWEFGSEPELEDQMIEIGFAIRARGTLGVDHSDSFKTIHHCVRSFMDYYSDRMQNPFSPPLWVPTSYNRKVRSTLNCWWAQISKFVDEPTRLDDTPDNLLGILRKIGENPVHAMEQQQLRDEIASWMMTGTETISNILAWTWYLLAGKPDVKTKLQLEIDNVLKGDPATQSDLGLLTYTQATLKESMRLFPQSFVIGRKAISPFSLGDYHMPKGTTLMLNQWSIGRDDRWFDDPLNFQPERWQEKSKDPSKFAYFPFGRGKRICAGRKLAMIDLTLALATLAQRFDFQMASDTIPKPRVTLTLRPTPGMQARLVPR